MQDLITLLKSSLDGLTAELAITDENIRAMRTTEADIIGSEAFDHVERRIREDELHAQYREFCEECRRDLDPIEAEHGGVITYAEWKLWIQSNNSDLARAV